MTNVDIAYGHFILSKVLYHTVSIGKLINNPHHHKTRNILIPPSFFTTFGPRLSEEFLSVLISCYL